MCSPSVGRSSFAVSTISALMSVSRGCSGCLRAKASRCWVRSAPRSAASSIILAIAASCGRSGDCVRQDLDRAGDDGEDVVEVVRDAAGELPDRFHLLRLAKLRFGRDLFGQIADEAVEHVSAATAKRRHAELDLDFPAVARAAPRSRSAFRGSRFARCAGTARALPCACPMLFRNDQITEDLADGLAARPPEYCLGLPVPIDDPAGFIHLNEGIERGSR